MQPTKLTQMKFRWWILNSDRQSEDALYFVIKVSQSPHKVNE